MLTGSSLIGSADVRPAGAGFHAVDPATGAELEEMLARGFTAIGPQRVWIR